MSRAANKYGQLESERQTRSSAEMRMPATTTENDRDAKRKTPREEPTPIVRTKSVFVQPPKVSKTSRATESSTTQPMRKNSKRKHVVGHRGHARNPSSTESTQRLNVYSPALSEKDSIVSSTRSSQPSVSSVSSVDEFIPIKIDIRGTHFPSSLPSLVISC